MKIRSLILPVFVVLGTMSHADPAVIEGVSAQKNGPTWTFSVTLRHGDTGWDDYADGWRIVSPNGDVLGLDGRTCPIRLAVARQTAKIP